MSTRPRTTAALAAVFIAAIALSGPSAPLGASGATRPEVSYTAPPAPVVLAPFARVIPPAGSSPFAEVAVASDGATVVFDPGGSGSASVAYYAADDGTVSAAVPLSVSLSAVTPGPDHVIYGIARDPATGAMSFAAIPMGGPRLGTVISAAPIADASGYLEVGRASFGNTRDGVVDRTMHDGTLLLAHVDQNGNSLTDPALPTTLLSQTATSVIDIGPPDAWAIDIERVPEYTPGYSGEAAPARSAGGTNVWATFLGASAEPGVADPTLPVLAVMRPGERTEWYSITDGWQYASSDVWGTIFMRTAADGAIELARLPESTLTGEPTDGGEEPVCPEYTDHTAESYPIRLCDSGTFVFYVQGLLSAQHGYPLVTDGYYGPATEQAVRDFQSRNGVAVDGLTGPDTWAALSACCQQFSVDSNGNGVIDIWEFALDSGGNHEDL